MSCVNSISVVTRIISSTWFVGVQETKHFGNNNTSHVDAYDDIQLEFNMADVRYEGNWVRDWVLYKEFAGLFWVPMGIYYMEAWVLSRESAGLDGWTPLFATKRRQSLKF